MPSIKPLSASVVNKIAAGEVIERPASVVKELMENSIDAGATRVDVRMEQGGRELIRVTDNGCGIAANELTLAVSNHATSKITSADDLFEVATMGFRGEALASIAEVSRTLLRSRVIEADSGAELRVNGGVAAAIELAGGPVGTTIEVRDLFFNTPVRQRFLRTPQTEIGHATEAFVRIALAHPHVHCRLEHGTREVHDLAPTDDWRLRIAQVFGDELADSLIEVESVDPPITLTGYAANPQYSRANNRLQYLFLNGRNIRDRALQHALGEAYRGLLLTGRYPICFLRFDMPANLADVNVHPTKLEVRFQDGGRLYSQLLSTLRSKFLSTDLRAGPGGQGVSLARGRGGGLGPEPDCRVGQAGVDTAAARLGFPAKSIEPAGWRALGDAPPAPTFQAVSRGNRICPPFGCRRTSERSRGRAFNGPGQSDGLARITGDRSGDSIAQSLPGGRDRPWHGDHRPARAA